MRLKTRLGLLIFKLGLKVTRKGMTMAGIVEIPQETNECEPNGDMLIHRVLEGPFTRLDMAPDDWVGPSAAEAFLLVRSECNGELEDIEWFFETVEEAFTWVRYFKTSIDPMVIKAENIGRYDA